MNRWIIPIVGALGIHMVIFHVDPAWNQPALLAPENKTVTLSLTTLPAPAPQKPAPKPVPNPKPKARKKPVVKKLDPVPQPQPEQLPKPEPVQPLETEPEPATKPETNPDAAPIAESTDTLQSAEAMPGPDQAQLQASVPLYHLNPSPTYPAVARRRNYQGVVLLDVLVNPQGRVDQIKVARSSGYTILDRSAEKSVRQWRFTPAKRFGRAVEMWVQVPVRFKLR